MRASALAALLGAGLLGVSLLAGAPAAAATFAAPAGCRLELTVQNRSCSVSQHYRCDADAPGDQWVEYYGPEGATYRSRIDAETRWMESIDLLSGLTDRLEEGGADEASLSTLLETGADDFDFWTVSDDGERLHHVGRDELTGETVELGGETLEVTRFALRSFDADGNLLIERRGQQFVSRAHGRFYGGIETAADWTGEARETNDSPVRFIRPGEPGFGSTTPEYDCEMQMVRAGGRHGG